MTKEDIFVSSLCHAFRDYGIRYQTTEEETLRSSILYDEMIESIQENWNEIVDLSETLEYFCNV